MLLSLIPGLLIAPQAYTKRLPDGMRVRLEAVASAKVDRFWSPGGGRVAVNRDIGFVRQLETKGSSPADPHLRHLLVTIEGVMREPSALCRFGDGPARTPELSRSPSLRGMNWLEVFEGNSRDKDVTVGVGFAVGPWTTKGTVTRQSGGKGVRSGIGFFRNARPGSVQRSGKSYQDQVIVEAVVPADAVQHAYRVAVVDRKGKELDPMAVQNKYLNHSTEYTFPGRYADVSRVELQARPVTWLSFPHVRLNPK